MIRNYLKIAWRSLKRNKAYTFINLFGLVLSWTSAILIFVFISFHLGFDDFHKSGDRIYRFVTEQKRETVNYVYSVPPALGRLVRDDYDFEEEIARVVSNGNSQITYGNNEKVLIEEGVDFVDPAFFKIFNFPLIQGNVDKEFIEPNKVALTENMAKRFFGDQPAIGKTLKINNKIIATVTAVLKDLPENTFEKSQIFLSFPSVKDYDEWYLDTEAWNGISSELQCFIKLKNGVSSSHVEKAMAPFPAKFRPSNSNIHTYYLQPLNEMHFDAKYRGLMPKQTLWILAVIGLFLIISACLNFVNLATAQAFKRLKEVGVRKSLGGQKRQLFWQFLTETSIISFISILVSIFVVYLFLPYLNQLFDVKISVRLLTKPSLLIFGFLIFSIASFLSGTYPGLLLARFSPAIALKGRFSNIKVGSLNLRKGLIITQFVISQILIIGMLVIIKQMNFNQNADLGFNKNSVIMVPLGNANEPVSRNSLKQRLLDKADIESVSACFSAPASENGWGTTFKLQGKDEDEAFHVSVKSGDESYLKTFELELIAGRNIRMSDTLTEVVVNEMFTRKMNYQSPDEAIGKHIEIARRKSIAIVGVVHDFHTASMHEEISPVVLGTFDNVLFNYAIKINPNNIQKGLKDVEAVWSEQNPDGVFTYDFVDEDVKNFYQSEQRLLSLIEIFTVIAISIGALGLFGLITFMVERKNKEIGVRKVLGGTVSHILWIFGKEFAFLILIAFAIAAPVSWWFSTRWLQNFQFRIDIGIGLFATALLFSVIVASVSIILKVFKAALVNPVDSLRSE